MRCTNAHDGSTVFPDNQRLLRLCRVVALPRPDFVVFFAAFFGVALFGLADA